MSAHPTSRPLALAAAALISAAVLTGCAGPALPKDAGPAGDVSHAASSSPAAAAKALDTSKLDACTLLPQSDAETLVGNKVLDPIKVSTSDVASCTYASDPNGPTGQVEVYVGDGAKQQLAIDKDKLQHTFTQPTGLGDEAWQEDDWIWARTGQNWISIRIVELRGAAQFATPLQTAMGIALKNLATAG